MLKKVIPKIDMKVKRFTMFTIVTIWKNLPPT